MVPLHYSWSQRQWSEDLFFWLRQCRYYWHQRHSYGHHFGEMKKKPEAFSNSALFFVELETLRWCQTMELWRTKIYAKRSLEICWISGYCEGHLIPNSNGVGFTNPNRNLWVSTRRWLKKDSPILCRNKYEWVLLDLYFSLFELTILHTIHFWTRRYENTQIFYSLGVTQLNCVRR